MQSRSLRFPHWGLLVLLGTRPVFAATPGFSDQTTAAGIAGIHGGSGSPWIAGGCVADFNGDGWQDIYFCTGSTSLPDQLLINNGDGTFTDQAAAWGVSIIGGGAAAVAGDYDGDGRIDLAVTVSNSSSAGQHRLFRNLPNDTFEDVTAAAGLIIVDESDQVLSNYGWGAAWGDYDLDGDLDLVVNTYTNRRNRLYRNLGNGTFEDQAEAALGGVQNSFDGFAPRFCDMDGDRFPELLWISDFHTGRYFVNSQLGFFVNATTFSHTMVGSTEMGSTVADFDRNGLFDFYVTTINANNLYMNQGSHQYTQVAQDAGVRITGWGWGAVSPDIDHDGWPDIIATGFNGQFAFLNNSDCPGCVEFSDVSLSLGIRGDSVDSGQGLANFDYDNDGDQDVLVFQHHKPLKLYRNDLTGDGDIHWLRVFLDTSAAADIAPNGIGSVVKVTTNGFTQMGRIDGGSNYLSQSEMSAHFGLATATVVDELRIEWTNGAVTVMSNVPADQTITIPAPAPVLLGDMNCDGIVDIADAAPFATALADAAVYATAYPSCDIAAADLDGNSVIDARDIAAFVLELLN
ncbi:MAG: VCBS repeat-containing protein [Phycisphaerales bacterium]|nr:VCBS repeat-containing protein [Phycisphaerales bacterium]